MLITAPVVKLDRKIMPAPAYTDFSKIFIAREANTAQERLLITHEQAHIWLNHQTRKPDDFGTETFDRRAWDMSLEVEISRNIYTQVDDDEISKPMTILSGGVTSQSFPKLPKDLLLAEEIYDWFKANPDEAEKEKAKMFCACKKCDGDTEEKGQQPTPSDFEEIKEALEKHRKTMEAEAEKATITSTFSKKPSLAGEIDYILRARKVKNKTYAKPSRRESEPFILRGTKKTKKVPKVEIFVDRSGSMRGERTQSSLEKLDKILRKYQASIEHDVFYFSNGKIYDRDIPANGGNPYPLVMAHLEKSRPKIAIIITDYDLEETEGLKPLSHNETKILCLPVDENGTAISQLINSKDYF